MSAVHPLVAEIISLREKSGMSRQEAARRAGVSVHVVRMWELGRCSPNLVTLEAYAAVFGKRLVWRDEGMPPITPQRAAENRRVLLEALDAAGVR